MRKINIGIFSLLGTISIFIAAFTISSKKAVNPKVRIWAFISYIGACIFLGTWGALIPDIWMVIQQVVLFGINVRGIYNARRDLKNARENRS